MFWKPTLAIQGDPGNFIVSLQAALKGYTCDPEWPKTLKARDDEKEAKNRCVLFCFLKVSLIIWDFLDNVEMVIFLACIMDLNQEEAHMLRWHISVLAPR
jgi:hypothetical protein